ncbi:hypothetical protein BH09BAC4_BH09BAC4_16300 [soil metagenome]
MKRYLLFFLLGLAVLPACGQGVADYYRLPAQEHQYKRLVTRYGGPQIRDRWYVALEGFVKTDHAQLDNSINGLLESDRVAKASWGVVVGLALRERWMIEGGYSRLPIHTQVSVRSISSPLVFRYMNGQNAFVLRGKRLVLSTSKSWLRSGFWLSGGLWAVTNSGEQEGVFSLISYGKQGYRESRDTLRLSGRTHTNTQLTALAEVGAEYNVRLSNSVDLGISARKFFGFANSINTNVTYTVNGKPFQEAQLQGTGSGMSYGMTLRYTFATRRTAPNVMEVRGKMGHIR